MAERTTSQMSVEQFETIASAAPGTITVHSSPDRAVGGYRDVHTAKFGEKVLLPDPIGFELHTEILGNYVR